MSPVQAGGGQGSGQTSGGSGGPGGRKPGQGSGRPPAKAGPAKTGQAGRPAANSTGTPRSAAARAGGRAVPPKKPGGAGAAGGQRKGTPKQSSYTVTAKAPRRMSASTLAIGAVAVVVILVVVLVVVKISGGSSTPPNNVNGPVDTLATPATVSAVLNTPLSVQNTVGAPSGITAPMVDKNQPPLTINGKPGAVFIGGEFCPYCAAERWSILLAFSHFGTFSGLKETTSSPWDADPATATFSFNGATYTSSLISFDPVEYESNDSNGLGTRHVLNKLTSQQQNLWSKYEAHFGQSTGFPFMDFNNKVFVVAPSYNPQVLQGMTQPEIAAQLTNASSQVTQGIVGTANYLTAAICSMTNQQPSSVCSASGITKATKALGLSS